MTHISATVYFGIVPFSFCKTKLCPNVQAFDLVRNLSGESVEDDVYCILRLVASLLDYGASQLMLLFVIGRGGIVANIRD